MRTRLHEVGRPACAGRTAASLSDVTAGQLALSRRHREVRRPAGYSDELRVVLSSSTGTWGALTVFTVPSNVTIFGVPNLGSMAWAGLGLIFAARFIDPLNGGLGEEPGWRVYALPRM
jgi:hypothetical protein